MKRTFIAIHLVPGEEFCSPYRELKRELRTERIKWVEDHNLHLTLKFLGDTESTKIALIGSILGDLFQKQSAFNIQLNGLGIFGSRYDPCVIWTGIKPYEAVSTLMKSVHQSLIPAGFTLDRQNLVPHLTLGRINEIKDKPGFQKVVDRFKELKSSPIKVNEVRFYESILRKEGPEYIPLKVFSLM